MRASSVASIAAIVAAGCGGGAGTVRFPDSTRACGFAVHGLDVAGARCIEATNARVVAIRPDPSGDFVLAGVFGAKIAIDGVHTLTPVGTILQPFVARIAPDGTTRFARAVDAPGLLRGAAVTARGIAIVTSSLDLPEGPFLTRLDASGNVIARQNLGFGGLVTGFAEDRSRGVLAMRVQQDGVRVVVADEDGRVLGASQVAPPWVAQFPASVTADALLSDMALTDGVYTLVARGPSEDGAVSDQALVKVSGSGAVLWSRAVPVGANAQIVAAPAGGLFVLTPDATALCPGPIGGAFAVTALDGESNVTWIRCLSARAAELRIATDSSGRVVLSGQTTGHGDLGAGPFDIDGHHVASFVALLGDRGETRRVAMLDGADVVAGQSLAVGEGGTILVAGALATDRVETHVFIGALRE